MEAGRPRRRRPEGFPGGRAGAGALSDPRGVRGEVAGRACGVGREAAAAGPSPTVPGEAQEDRLSTRCARSPVGLFAAEDMLHMLLVLFVGVL